MGVGSLIGWDYDNIAQYNGALTHYLILFLVYLINYTVVIFFNVALVHCARLYFAGEPVHISAGIKFSVSRLGYIMSWAVFASTVGLALKIIQDHVGKIGKILIGIIGFAWSISTFFTVPIIAYENKNPWDALKESILMMKKLWGEGLTASFSFGLIQFGSLIAMLAIAFLFGMINRFLGIGVFIIGIVLILAIFSTLKSIFISAVYYKASSDIDVKDFADVDVDSLFSAKK